MEEIVDRVLRFWDMKFYTGTHSHLHVLCRMTQTIKLSTLNWTVYDKYY